MPTIRRADASDAPALTALAISAYERYVPRIGHPPAPMTADYADAVEAGHTWVAEDAGQVVGLLVLVPYADHLLLENVAVHPDAQGTGLGGRLLRLAEDEARRFGLAEIRLYTNAAMTENLDYYRRHGYAETPSRPRGRLRPRLLHQTPAHIVLRDVSVDDPVVVHRIGFTPNSGWHRCQSSPK